MKNMNRDYKSELQRIADSLEKLVKIHGEHMKVSVYNENGSWSGNKENEWYEKKTNTKD
mgnify:CR=1 FL=1